MPQLGETVTEGTIVRWLKQVGDAVAVDDPLFEVSTDKVDTEVPSAFAGYLRPILVAEGDTVPIGTPLAWSPTPPTSRSSRSTPARSSPPAPRSAATAGHRARTAQPGRQRLPAAPARDVALSPVVRRLLAQHGLEPGQVVGSGRQGRITRSDVLAAAAEPPPRRSRGPRPRRTRSPDVVARSRRRRAHRPSPGPGGSPPPTCCGPWRPRRTRWSSPRSTTPAVDGVRREAGLSYLPFVARAVVDAIRRVPQVNASVGDDCTDRAPRRAPRHRRRPRLRGARRPGRARRRRQAAAARSPTAIDDAGGAGPARTSHRRRPHRRHVHDHQRRSLRHARHRADHQPAPGGDPVDRRRAHEAGGRALPDGELGRSRSTRSATSASASTTGPSTAPTPPRSWPASGTLLETRDWSEEL